MKNFDGCKKPYTSEEAEIKVQEEIFEKGSKMVVEGNNIIIGASNEIKRLTKILEEKENKSKGN